MNNSQKNQIAKAAVVVGYLSTLDDAGHDRFADGLVLAASLNGVRPGDLTPSDIVEFFDLARALMIYDETPGTRKDLD